MSRAKHIADKHNLFAQIRQLGQLCDEDIEFIRQYGQDVYNLNKDDLEKTIKCFQDLIRQAKELGQCRNTWKPLTPFTETAWLPHLNLEKDPAPMNPKNK